MRSGFFGLYKKQRMLLILNPALSMLCSAMFCWLPGNLPLQFSNHTGYPVINGHMF
jgi:hypothetical protein